MKAPLTGFLLGLSLLALGTGARAEGPQFAKDFTAVAPMELDVEFVRPAKDARTGFVVGGKNATALVRSLKEINGRSIADLEKDMHPGKLSTKGFLGKDEKLLDVLATDNDFVLDNLGLTHQELAKHLLIVGGIAKRYVGPKDEPYIFRYQDRRFRAGRVTFRGIVHSPFEDETKTNIEVSLENLDNGKKLKYSLLVPQMIERYGFYEGKDTPYRVDPREIVAVFDFIKVQKKQ